ncbi:hypothetical protein C8R46DRAFT_1019898 [Mycena filopes]|nr:hypothetical protein C8R46DRAFT_1019898 [Mycena filopes]
MPRKTHPTRINSDDENESRDSGSGSDEENGPEDVSRIEDPGRLREIIRELQLDKNTQRLQARRQFGDVTNTPEREKASKRKKSKTKQDNTSHKRARRHSPHSTPEPPQDSRHAHSDNDSGSDSSDEGEGATIDDETAIKHAGRRYVLCFNLWVRGNAHIFDVALDSEYDEKKRFENDATKRQGQLHDIEQVLPEEYRGKKRGSTKTWLGRLFMAGVTSQRSNTSTRLRKVAGAAIFDCSCTDLLDPDTRLDKFKDLIGWLVEEETSGSYSSLEVPILHDRWAGDYDLHTCFLNPALMRLFVALIRGPSAATILLTLQKKNGTDAVSATVPRSDNLEAILNITHTEPGAIAGSAVLAIWALSADIDLKARGDRTHIDYEARFDEYLEILTTGLSQKSASILNIFKEGDRVVFPASDSGYARDGAENQGTGNKKAMEALRAEMEVDDEA